MDRELQRRCNPTSILEGRLRWGIIFRLAREYVSRTASSINLAIHHLKESWSECQEGEREVGWRKGVWKGTVHAIKGANFSFVVSGLYISH